MADSSGDPKPAQPRALAVQGTIVRGGAERETRMEPMTAEAALPAPAPVQSAPITPLRVVPVSGGNRTDGRLVLVDRPDSGRAAAFRVLRYRLGEQGHSRVVVVSSPSRGEGKSTCAMNLALALGEHGRSRVLLVEANFRYPGLAKMLGVVPPECFAIQLGIHRERPYDPWSVVEIFSPSTVHVLMVHPKTTTRNQMDPVSFAAAIARFRSAGYDHIVIDTPGVLGNADVNMVQDVADQVLLCAWEGKTSQAELRDAVEQLSPSRLGGIVLLEQEKGPRRKVQRGPSGNNGDQTR